jgi:hypothetical protein
MTKKTVEKKRRFPKIPAVKAKGIVESIIDVATDVAAEAAKAKGVPDSVADALNEGIDNVVIPRREAPKVPEAEVIVGEKKHVKIEMNAENKIHIDILGFNPFEALVVIKNAHRYLFETVKKEVDKLNVGSVEEGATDASSGSNT